MEKAFGDKNEKEILMEHKLMEWKAAGAAVISVIGAVLGWRGILVLTWVALMGLDYLTGSLAALKKGEWSSARAREGIWHKAGALLVTAVAGITDGMMLVLCGHIPVLDMEWPELLLPMILAWYILTELGSILENAVHLGANPPGWLVKALEAGKKAVEDAGEQK